MKIRTSLLAGAALALATVFASTGAQANLLVNGSFETGDMTGWTTDSPYGLNPFGTTYGAGMDGTYWHWVAGYEIPIVTSQTVTGLTVGSSYNLTFIMASEFVNSDSVRVSVNGGPGTIFTAPPYIPGGGPGGGFWDVWVPQLYTFTATSTSAMIQFDSVGLNLGGYDVGIDNVSLTSGVPEPATWAMMLMGFGGLGAMLRSRRRGAIAA